jgi:LacI family transcriptional regulator
MSRNKFKHHVTMAEVAKHAGVSQTTVSLVINNSESSNLPLETKERVLNSIKALGYRPNAAARHMRTRRSNLIGCITDKIATTPFAGRILEGAYDAARVNNKTLVFVNTNGDPEVENSAIELLLEQRVEGIVYASEFNHTVYPPDSIQEVPVILVDCNIDDHSLPSVVPNEVQGGRDATEALLKRGHRKVGFINSVHHIPARYSRLEGYRQALEKFGIELNDDYITYVEDNADGGYLGGLELMGLSDPPTAIFCFNDRVGMGVYDAIRELHLSIPEDVSLIGFDNQEIISKFLRPQLSSMELPHYQMGYWGIDYLVNHLEALESNQIQHLVECPLVERASVGEVRK